MPTNSDNVYIESEDSHCSEKSPLVGTDKKHSSISQPGWHNHTSSYEDHKGYGGVNGTTDLHKRKKSGSQKGRRYSRNLSFCDATERITLTWDGISVFAPPKSKGLCSGNSAESPPKQILKEVSGAVQPGTLLAIVGASGAGKTTLLNVLTYRNRGNLLVEGDVRVNGSLIGCGMPSISAYIQQDDLFIGTLKVKEHLWFQSMLRMDKEVPYSVRQKRVDAVMHEMGLTKCADVLIGIPGKIKGISGGEKKRLSFASEVLTNPPLMFCDEPTSGLDAFMAQNIVATLQSMALKGRTIICTIHQPSSETFAMFDRILLMAEGKVAFLGPANEALNFFETSGYPCPRNYNPADHYVHTLAVIPGKELECRQKIEKICVEYSKSQYENQTRAIIKASNFDEDGVYYEENAFENRSPYKASWLRQFQAVFWRCWLSAAREPGVFRTRLVQACVLSLIFGLIYLNQTYDQQNVANINGVLFLMLTQMTFGFVFSVIMVISTLGALLFYNQKYDQKGITNINGALFSGLVELCFNNLWTVFFAFPAEFPIFLREHHDGMYRVDVYFLCKTFAELPQFMLIPVAFTTIMYWLVGLFPSAEAFFICLAVMFLCCNVSVSFGYMLSSSSSNVSLVLALGPIFVVPIMMIGGFYINVATIPSYFLWLKYVSWFTYANEILVVNQWKNVENITCNLPLDDFVSTLNGTNMATISPSEGSDARCFYNGKQVIQSLSYSEDSMAFNFTCLVALLISFRVISFILLFIRSRKNYKINKK